MTADATLAVSPPTKAKAPPVIKSRTEALDRVRALLPGIAARAERTEAERVTPRETIQELLDAGLFGIPTPKRFGGSELGFAAMVEVAAEIASVCGSSGWVYGVLAGHNWMLGLFPKEAQEEVFSDPAALTASVFRMGGTTTEVPGGYRLTQAEGRFCSGVDHSRWVIVGASVKKPDGPPESRFHLIPISEVEIIDDWFTAGMRGTGSRSIKIADAFIPAHRSVAGVEMMTGATPGAAFHKGSSAYALPFPVGQPFSLIGAPLGIARGALNLFAEQQSKKFKAMSPEQMGEQGASFVRLAKVSAEIDAARALIIADCERLDAIAPGEALTPLDRARILRDLAFAAQSCRYAVTNVFEAGGGSGIYDSSPLQRYWRDGNSATAHAAFVWDEAAAGFGRTFLGLPPSPFSRR